VFPQFFLLHKVVRDAKKVEKHCTKQFIGFKSDSKVLIHTEYTVCKFNLYLNFHNSGVIFCYLHN